MKGTLYVVSTPIGNLEDITLRALRTLKEADLIAAEDTRHSLKLLTHYEIKKPLISYWSERERQGARQILERLRAGDSVALISDAGTPGISDPGYLLIKQALEEEIDVVSIPGACALVAALSVSGLSAAEFTFIGFLPPKKNERLKKLRELAFETRSLIFYEAPHRVLECLSDMEEVFSGARRVALMRELTKFHEETLRGELQDVLDRLEDRPTAGEYVLVVEGRPKEKASVEEATSEVINLMKKGMGRKDAVKTVAEQYGLAKKELYERSLSEQGLHKRRDEQ